MNVWDISDEEVAKDFKEDAIEDKVLLNPTDRIEVVEDIPDPLECWYCIFCYFFKVDLMQLLKIVFL